MAEHTWEQLAQIPLATIMSRDVETVPGSTPLAAGAKLMRSRHLGSLIDTSANAPVGIFTELDLCRAISRGRDPNTVTVSEEMSSDLIVALAYDPVIAAMEKMANRDIRHLPVMEGKELVGIVSDRDLIASVSNMIGFMELVTRAESNGGQSIPESMKPIVGRGMELVTRAESNGGQSIPESMKPIVGRGTALDIARPLVYLAANETLEDAAQRLRTHSISECLFGKRALPSILTVRDITKAIAKGADPSEEAVAWTTSPLTACDAATSIHQVGRLMVAKHLRHLVVGSPGAPLGVISDRQLASLLPLVVATWRAELEK